MPCYWQLRDSGMLVVWSALPQKSQYESCQLRPASPRPARSPCGKSKSPRPVKGHGGKFGSPRPARGPGAKSSCPRPARDPGRMSQASKARALRSRVGATVPAFRVGDQFALCSDCPQSLTLYPLMPRLLVTLFSSTHAVSSENTLRD